MGYNVSDFKNAPFEKLERYLLDENVSIEQYLASEYFLRKFMTDLDSALRFPDEIFSSDRVSRDTIRKHLKNFNRDHPSLKWGFHPLVRSGVSIKIDFQMLKDSLASLSLNIPTSTNFHDLNALWNGVRADLDNIELKINKVEDKLKSIDSWKKQKIAYLFLSKEIANIIFEFRSIDIYIEIKHDCYFQDDDTINRDTLRKAIAIDRFAYSDTLKTKFKTYLDDENVKRIVDSFEDSRKGD